MLQIDTALCFSALRNVALPSANMPICQCTVVCAAGALAALQRGEHCLNKGQVLNQCV